METRQLEDGRGGAVSAAIAYPDGFTAGRVPGVILAHGAGNDRTNPLLVVVHEGLARQGYLSVTFNFPYTEQGRRVPVPAPVLEACYRSVLAAVRTDTALRPPHLVIGGKSLGGRIASQLAAQGDAIDGVLLLGYPLHPNDTGRKLRDRLPQLPSGDALLDGDFAVLVDPMQLEDAFGHINPECRDCHDGPSLSLYD